jgi:hypothetical protein
MLKIPASTQRCGKIISKRFKNLTCTQTVHCGQGSYFSFGALLIVEDIDVVLDSDLGFIK